jgi:DNA-binding transcriptional regulator YdaS (Cro superfamily)
MNLKDYTNDHSQSELAKLIGFAPSFVNQWVSGKRPVPVVACVAIEQVTSKAVTRQELRPDDWHLIWPELVQATATIAQPAATSVAG